MRTTNCKSVCREIDESNIGQDLSSVAREHVQSCEHCRSFYDGRRELRLMLGSLETVAAPSDFEFRVRARLANNEGTRSGFFFGNRSWGIPVATVATLVLLLGAGFAFRTLTGSDGGTTAGHSENPRTEHTTPNTDQPKTKTTGSESISAGNEDAKKTDQIRSNVIRELKPIIKSSKGTVAAQRTSGKLATQDFSILGASVVKQSDSVASRETSPVFAVETSSEPLKVSLDFETGASRTISLPTLSFGSQRTIAGSNALVKTSTKGVW
ncbi:MAG TPA: hypothetical protein VFH31_08870 [Pyrinomonadaceae bacterium]|nr:hypothetical protein [Pyrinomonadaceae bacterium]